MRLAGDLVVWSDDVESWMFIPVVVGAINRLKVFHHAVSKPMLSCTQCRLSGK